MNSLASREVTYTVNPTRVDLSGFTKANKAMSSLGRSAIGVSKTVITGFGRMASSATRFAIKTGKVLGTVSTVAIGASIKMAASAEEVENKFVVSFANMSDAANEWINTFSNTVGRSRFETKEMLADTQDLLTGFGATTNEAFKLAKQIQETGVDLASFNNLQDVDAVTRFRKGLLGEHENFKALGIIVNQTNLQQEAYDQGINKTLKNIDELTKINLRYSIALRQSRNAQGDARRSMGSLTNQSKGLLSNIKDTATAFGSIFIPQATKVVTFLNTKFADAFTFVSTKLKEPLDGLLNSLSLLGRMVFFIGDQVRKAFDFGDDSFGIDLLNSLDSITERITTFTQLLFDSKDGIITFFIGVINAINTFVRVVKKELQPIINFVADIGQVFVDHFGQKEIGPIINIVKNLGAIFKSMFSIVGSVAKAALPPMLDVLQVVIHIFDGIVEAIALILVPAAAWFKAVFEGDIPEIARRGVELIGGIFGAFATLLITFFETVFDFGALISDSIKLVVGDIVNIVKNILEPIQRVIDKIKELLKLLKSKALDFFKGDGTKVGGSNFGILGFELPGFADGVSNFAGGFAIVGERGPEVVNLPQGSSVTSNKDMIKMFENIMSMGRTSNISNKSTMLMEKTSNISNRNVMPLLKQRLKDININIKIEMKDSTGTPREFVENLKQPLRSEVEKIFRSLASEMGL